MSDVAIFVEGSKDVDFIRVLLKQHFGAVDAPDGRSLITASGKHVVITKTSNYAYLVNSENVADLQENTRNGIINLVIFDADNNFQQRQQLVVNQWTAKYSIQYECFLFPDNQQNGVIENLLEQCLRPDYLDSWRCVVDYRQCLATKGHGKAGIKGQFSILLQELGYKHKEYDQVIDFHSPALAPLIAFLQHYL